MVLGVTGSVAAVQSVKVARELRRHGAVVKPFATESALWFVGRKTLEWACDEEPVVELTGRAEHLEFSDADALLIAPATANVVGKMAAGIADDSLTSLAAAFDPEDTVVAPAMHVQLYESDKFRENLETLRDLGVRVVRPVVKEGAAKLPRPEEVVSFTKRTVRDNDLPLKVVVTGGTTAEALDDIRVVTTRASGRTGAALAREAYERGGDVTLVYGRGTVEPPRWVETARVETAEEMTESTLGALEGADLLVSSAAISDHTVEPLEGKHPGDEPLELEMRTVVKLVDLAAERYPDLDIVAFKAESRVDDEELLEAAKEKLGDGVKLVVANDVSREDAGFESEENEVIIVDGGSGKLRASKAKIAEEVLDRFA